MTDSDHSKIGYRRVILLGAGRSGTNLLRDGLTRLPGVATWPCDEINYLWRTGSADFPTDELPRNRATASVQSRVRAAFDWVAKRHQAGWVVEKTCANTLRVDYVEQVLGGAIYLHLTRDGYDVTRSAMARWSAAPDPRYLLKKARFVPAGDIPKYAARYLASHWRRLRSQDRALPTWGPRFSGIDELRRTAPLSVVCATQWRRCVEAANASLSRVPSERVLHLTYEGLVTAPAENLARIAGFLGVDAPPTSLAAFASGVRVESIGAGRQKLASEDLQAIRDVVEEVATYDAAA